MTRNTLFNSTATARPLALLVTVGFAGLMPSARAHHPMGGQTPETFSQGLLSGFGHPIIGIDHLAFLIVIY